MSKLSKNYVRFHDTIDYVYAMLNIFSYSSNRFGFVINKSTTDFDWAIQECNFDYIRNIYIGRSFIFCYSSLMFSILWLGKKQFML